MKIRNAIYSPYYFGSFNGIAENYTHDITEDYPLFSRLHEWISEKFGRL